MIYYVLRFLARMALYFNFRKVYIEGLARVPKGRHVIYGLNHPTAFLDPIILMSHVPETLWAMLRGDKFVNAPVRYFLHAIQNLPIYRASDGDREAVRGNVKTMSFATDRVLEGNGTVILSEGVCRHERRLRPIQRGTARMLFQAWKKDKSKDVCIMPAGINYTAPNTFRSSAVISFGEPIRAADYAADFKADSRATIEAVTAELQRRLRGIVIHVEDRRREPTVELLLPLIQHDRPDAGVWPHSTSCPYVRAQWHATEVVNGMDDFEAGRLGRDLDAYYAELDRRGVTDSGLAMPHYGSLARGVALWLLGIVAMFGWLINYPVAAIVQRRVEKMVNNPQFYASVRFGLGMGFYVVYCLIWTAVMSLFFGWWALLTPLAFAVSGYAYLQYRDAFELWRQSARVKSLDDATLHRLLAERRDVLRRVGALGEQDLPVDPELA